MRARTRAIAIRNRLPVRRLTALALGPVLLAGLLAAAARPVSAAALAKADPALVRLAERHPGATLPVIVREARPAGDEAERLVRELEGRVVRNLAIVGGFAARLPASALRALAASPAVSRLWGDGRVRMSSIDMSKYDRANPNTVWRHVTRVPHAQEAGYTGRGVTIASLDTGVSMHPDLTDRVRARVDLTPDRDGLDRYGHGNHMAGVMVGDGRASAGQWGGVAPEAGLVSVKVAGWDGATDVSVVIAGLQWIVRHRETYNIRVLNLAFGTDSRQPYGPDPLNYAVEQAWFSGILVVVSAGNRGGKDTINKPGDDPYVVTVGAMDLKDTPDTKDDKVAAFSSSGPTQDGFSKPDLFAPGIAVVAPLAADSTLEATRPEAVLPGGYIKGSGTSQAAAIVSGVAAMMFQAAPDLHVDVAKATLVRSANSGSGAPVVDAKGAATAAANRVYVRKPANQGLTPSTGTGSLEASRGSLHVVSDPDGDGVATEIAGEIDVLGNPWVAKSWSASAWDESPFSALTATTSGWDAKSWSAKSWSGMGWDAKSWAAKSWSDSGWDAKSWSAKSWSAKSWS